MNSSRSILCLAVVSMMAAIVLTVATAQQTQPATGRGSGRGGAPAPTFPPGERQRIVQQLGSRDVRIHDPSTIIKCKDEYWVFYTGGGTPSYHSKDLVTWVSGPATFTASPSWLADVVPPGRSRGGRGAGPTTSTTGPAAGPATTAARGRGGRGPGAPNFWAPDIIHLGDRYLLYFSYSAFGVNTSAIAVASNPTLDPADPQYKWTELGIVVQTRQADDFNCIDPAVTQDAQGNLWLAFGSFWSGIKLIQLDPTTGKRVAPDSPMYNIAWYSSIEASDIHYHDGYYYLFVDWGLCCRGVNSTYDMRIGRSARITGPYLDKDGKDMLAGGGSPLLQTDGAFIGPGHAGILKDGDKYWLSMHFYDGSGGPTGPNGTLAIRPLTWAADGWPVVGKLDSKP